MNQYTHEHSILYVNKLKRQQLTENNQPEALPTAKRKLHLTTRFVHWLQSTLPKKARYLQQRRDEAGH